MFEADPPSGRGWGEGFAPLRSSPSSSLALLGRNDYRCSGTFWKIRAVSPPGRGPGITKHLSEVYSRSQHPSVTATQADACPTSAGGTRGVDACWSRKAPAPPRPPGSHACKTGLEWLPGSVNSRRRRGVGCGRPDTLLTPPPFHCARLIAERVLSPVEVVDRGCGASTGSSDRQRRRDRRGRTRRW